MGFILIIFLGLIIFKLFTAKVTSIAFMFSMMTALLYLVPYFTLWDTFSEMDFVSEEFLSPFFTYIFLCYLGFVVGDAFGASSGQKNKYSVDLQKFEKMSIITGMIGLAGYGYFIYKSGSGYFVGHLAGDFSVGGYVYELRYFIFSSVLLLFNLFLNKTISKNGLIFLGFCCAFLCFDAYIQQQRGSWIRFGVIFIFSYLFAQKDAKSLHLGDLITRYKGIFISGVFLGILLTFTVQIRKFYSPNTSFFTQVSQTADLIISQPDLLFGGSGIDEGNEFVVAFNGFIAGSRSGHYDYGLKWLYPFMNFIPRGLWAGKPYWHTFSIQIFDEIDNYSLIKSANGSAETGYIDAFFRFSSAAPLFFILFGFFTSRIQAASENDIRYRFFYICMYVGSFYFITQNMMPFVIFTLYMYIPIAYISATCFKKVR